MAVTTPDRHPERGRAPMPSSHPLPVPCQWSSRLSSSLDRRSAPRLALLFLGAVLARGRRTVTTWIRAANLSGRYRSCYIAVAAAGKQADRIARRLLTEVVQPLLKGATRLTLALDDTPTKRYGPHVQGAGVHHNPTPGPAGAPYVYGRVFVVLALASWRHGSASSDFGAIACGARSSPPRTGSGRRDSLSGRLS